MNHHGDPPGGPPAGDEQAARLARDDIYRLVALLWQLDRLHHPVLRQAPGDFRIATDPPALLPPTGIPGMPADQAPQVWAPEPARRPQRPLPPVTVAWVEPAAGTADGRLAGPTPPRPAPQPPFSQPPAPPLPPAPAPTGPPAAQPTQPAPPQPAAVSEHAEASPIVVPRGPTSLPDTPPAQSGRRTPARVEDPGDGQERDTAPAEPDRRGSPPRKPSAGPPTGPPQVGPVLAAGDPPAIWTPAPGPAQGSPDIGAAATVPVPAVRPGPAVPRSPDAASPAPTAPPAVEPPGYPQLAKQVPDLAAGAVVDDPPHGPAVTDSAVTSWPQTSSEPTVIVPTGQFSPSPVPAPADAPPPEPDDSDLNDDWDQDPLPDPGRFREAIVLRRGQQAGTLTRAQAARLEEELRRRFRDRSPGGSA